MTTLHVVDAFTAEPFTGNPARGRQDKQR